jgi:hypothetical protein
MARISNSVVTFHTGMYLLRHPGSSFAPISVSRTPGNGSAAGVVQRLGTPGTDGEVLRTAADCIAIVVSGGSVDLLVSAFLAKPDDAVPQLRVDRVALGELQQAVLPIAPSAATKPALPASTAAAPAAVSKPIRIGPHGISLIGHLGTLGDAVAAEGELLGDMETGRLEGFQVMWPDHPQGVDLAYRIGVEGGGLSAIVQTGKFVGTRGKGQRITEVSFALVGPQAKRYILEGNAYFSGGFSTPVVTGTTLSGPSGMEHLTALRVRAQPVATTTTFVRPKAPLHGMTRRGKK